MPETVYTAEETDALLASIMQMPADVKAALKIVLNWLLTTL